MRCEPLLKTPTRGIRANKFIGRSINHKKRSEVLDMNGEIDGCMGVIHLNKEYQYNMLTPSFINEINRGIASLDVNQIVSTIFMAPQLGQEFSNGTDFKALAQMQKEGNNDAIASYLTQIYRLQVQMAALNKPLIAVAPGHSFNSGATLLAASGIPLVNNGSKLAFNEALFGFVPHAGATYYLSRLPGEFGTFLALTGMRVDGSDAIKLGLAHGAVQDPLKLQEDIGEIVRSQEYRPEYGQEYFRNRLKKIKGTPLPQHFVNASERRIVEEWKNLGKFEQIDKNRLANGELDMGDYEQFIEAKDRIPSAVAEAEYRYMKMLRADEALQNETKPDPYLELGKDDIDRDNMFLFYESFKNQRNYITSFLGHWYKEDLHTAIRHQKLIDRCFYSRSVEEIMENLRKEPHPFAKECLEHMQRNSYVSLQLTREMMHRAQNLDYTGCMEMEVRVAVKRVSDPDFALGVEKVLKTKTPYVDGKAAKRTNPGFSKKKLNQSEIERYFDETPLTKKVNVGAVRYALLPTRHHFERFTDHLRIWINEESTACERIRNRFDQQAKEALRKEGIDVRDKALTIQDAREHLAAKLAKEHVEHVRQQRFNQIMLDEQLRDQYFAKVDKEYQGLVTDQAKFYNRVNQHISDIFDMALSERLEKIHERSREAVSLEKRRFIVGLKKFMFKNRVLSYARQSFKAELARLKNYPYRLPHGQELPEQSWHDLQHPQIDKSPLFLISKAIGRVSLSPVEMTKEYLTNPQAREQLSLLTLDKGELQKLQNDVLTDPEKYIKVFTRREKPNDDMTFLRNIEQEKFADRDFWWRFYHNTQITPMERWPKKQQFEMYKEWADDVESKAIDTLRSCLSQLLLSLKNDRKVKPQLDQAMTKREKLEHLMTLLDQSYDPATLLTAKRTKVLSRPNEIQTQGDLDQLHSLLQKLLAEDPHFQMLYKKDFEGNLSSNKRIAQLRSEAEEELLKLVEIVLLDKYGKHSTQKQQEILNERLKNLLTPLNIRRNSASVQQQLGVIDWYLEKEMRAEGLKDALDLVKPYFVNIFQRKLQEQATEVLNELQWKTTNHLVQLNYFGEMLDPGFSKHKQLRNKIYGKDWEHEKRIIVERAQPILSPNYQLKELQASYWTDRSEIHLDPKYQSLSLAEKKRQEENEVKKRNRDYAEIKAQIVFNQYKSKGIHNPQDIINAMMMGGIQTPEARNLVNNLNDENAAELEKLGFTKEHIRLLKTTKQLTAEIEATPEEEQVKYTNQELYKSLTRAEKHQIDTLGQQSEQVMRFLYSVRYEIENNMNSFDWLKMYAKVLSTNDFNELIEDYHYTIQRQKAQEKQTQMQMLLREEPEFEFVKPTNLLKSSEEWAQIKEYAEYLADFYTVNLKTIDSQVTIDLEEYMKDNKAQSIFSRAMADRNEYVRQKKNTTQLDRNLYIKGSIEDFNALQAQKETNQRLRDNIQASAATKPKQVRDFVDSLINDEKNYVDLQKLETMLESGNISMELDGLLDQQRLIQDLRLQGDLIPGFMESFAQTKTDVLSLDEARTRIASDNSLSTKEKSFAKEIIDHIADSSRLVANERRKAITISEFLGNQGSTNSESFTKYASNLLAQKLRDVVDSLDFAENPQNVEWELGRSRTSPFDLKEGGQKTRAEVDDLITRIVNDQEEDPIMKISYFDEEVNGFRLDRDREHELRKVLFDAADVTTFPHDLEQLKSLYENQFLMALTSPDSFEDQAQQIIGNYTDIRLKHCMLQPDFQAKMHSKYGFLYMKMLRERIIDELKITREADVVELSHSQLKGMGNDKLQYDVEAMYNLSHLNSVHAMGYDRLLERANAPSLKEQADIAQPTVVDKLLADYFLGKKSEVQEANKLIYDLAEMFNDDVKGKNSFDTVLKKQRMQNMDKQESRMLHFEAFKDMMDLDVITSRALQKNKNGLSNELRQLSITETDHKDHWLTQVPEYFDMMDVRKPPKQVVDDKLFMIIKQAFDIRKTLETKMSRRELLAFDQVLARHLQIENLAPRLQESIKEEFNIVNQGRQVIEHKNNNQFNERVQGYKRESMQREFNKSVKDSDAQYKSLAFGTMLEQQGKEIMERPGKSSLDKLELMFFEKTFPRWYLEVLDKDVHRNPRPINEDDYKTKKSFQMLAADSKFLNRTERSAQLFDDHRIYQENRKEQQERIQTFYILEQFFENARTKPDPNSSAQAAIKEYFAKPENTFFFDKNKI